MNKLFPLAVLLLALAGCAKDVDLQPRAADNRLGMAEGGSVEVKPGDTIYSIARRHNVPMSAVIAENQLKPPYVLQPGQSLRVPGASREDNVGLVVDPNTANADVSTRAVAASSLDAQSDVVSTAPLADTPVAAAPLATDTHEMVLTPLGPVTTPPLSPEPVVDNSIGAAPTKLTPDAVTTPAQQAPATAPSVPKGAFAWPVEGRPSNAGPGGVDIAAPKGTAVTAASGGTVASVTSDSGTIQHAGGITTTYGNLERVLVDKDAIVAKGDAIGTLGASGGGKAAQLHFSLAQNSQPVDPTAVLPAK